MVDLVPRGRLQAAFWGITVCTINASILYLRAYAVYRHEESLRRHPLENTAAPFGQIVK